MIVAIVGTPSPSTYMANNILRAIVQATSGDHDLIGANTIPLLRQAWPMSETRKSAVVISSDLPQESFINFLLAAKICVVACIEGVEEICDYMTKCRGFDAISAVRLATQALSNLESVILDPPPSLYFLSVNSRSLKHVVLEILAIAQCTTDAETIDRALAFLGFQGRGDISFGEFMAEYRKNMFPELGKSNEFYSGISDALELCARSYNTIAAGRRLERTIWPPECLLQTDSPGAPLHEPLTLEGKARFLSYGPYFHLPKGLWRIEISLEVIDSFSENRIGFDVSSGKVLAACTTTLPDSGTLACDMSFEVADANEPIEVRTQLLSGAIEGNLRVFGVNFRRF